MGGVTTITLDGRKWAFLLSIMVPGQTAAIGTKFVTLTLLW